MNKKQLKLFSSPEPLYTERLILRRIKKCDLNDVYEYAKNPNVSKYLLWSPHPSLEYTEHYLALVDKMYRKRQFYDYGIELIESGKMIGTCGFTSINLRDNSAEIGYVLNESYWGQRYAKEAVLKIIDFASQELKLDTLYAEFISENERSRALLSSLGFFEAAGKTYEMLVKGEYKNITVYCKKLTQG